MDIYKFRVLSDLNGDFVREIEILSTQTFEDFHNVLHRCIELNGKELASFHICDQKWNKLKEITLIDMMGGEPPSEEKKMKDVHIMKNARLKEFISEPNQRLLYEYDFLNLYTFFIELIRIGKAQKNTVYPQCTHKSGEFETEQSKTPQTEDEELSKKLLDDFDELLKQTYEYGSGDAPDDFDTND